MLRISEEVKTALSRGNVVALESTIITHGMPYPQNFETALLVENAVRENGSIPATIAIIKGVIRIGLSRTELEELARDRTAVKVSRRDIAQTVSQKLTGSTTVAATMIFAHMAGIRIFATGGIGGVHRGAEHTWDISADITELARTPVLVVCAGAKSILDLPRTLELLETGGVSVIGFKTSEFPAFFVPKSGLKTSGQCNTESDVANVLRVHRNLGLTSGLVLACPVPKEQAGNTEAIEKATDEALIEATRLRVSGKDITPFMLKHIHERTGGDSLKANIALIRNNASIAARVASSLATPVGGLTKSTRSSKIHVIGGISLDTIARPKDHEASGETQTSSPGIIKSGVGGVDRNIAIAINQLAPGAVSFESCIGDDESAATISVQQEANRYPWMRLHVISGAKTAHYSAVMNGDGSLCAGIADMSIFDSFNPSPVDSSGHELLIIGANLSEKGIGIVSMNSKCPVWIDCVSVSKAVKVVRSLPYLGLVKANLDEMATLAAVTPIEDASDHSKLFEWVERATRICHHQFGGNDFLVTCGRNGVYLSGRNVLSENNVEGTYSLPDKSTVKISCIPSIDQTEWSIIKYSSDPIEHVVDSTGAGDCLLGVTAWAHVVQGLSLIKSVVVGIAAARLTLMSDAAVSANITSSTLQSLLNQLHESKPLSAKL